jgi:energy-coupling factor transporter ATP-binding protein EcfA2
MSDGVGVLQIPASFETLSAAVGSDRIGQVLIECQDDLEAIKKAIAEVHSSGQGKLLFLHGSPGGGKTSLAQSTAIFLSDAIGFILTPPPEYEVSVTDLPGWINRNLADARSEAGANRIVLVNLDQREIPVVDEVATQGAMGNLNGLLRNSPNLLILWPVNNAEFAESAISRLKQAGGATALAKRPIHQLVGLPSHQYMDALHLLLSATSVSLQDAAISHEEVSQFVNEGISIGDFLRSVQGLVVERYDLGELGQKLPKLSVIFSCNDDIFNNCRILRRGSRFLIDPDKLLQFSRSNVADDWRRRGGENPRKGLAFISSLFEVKILNLSSSSVVNACAWGSDELKADVRAHYDKPVQSNAANSLRNSALARSLRGEEDVGHATSNPSKKIRDAFLAIQRKTNPLHKDINSAIVSVLTDTLAIQLSNLEYEYKPLSDTGMGLQVDAWSEAESERPIALEFTHRRDGDASIAVLSSYILNKVQDYARDYGLI